MSKSTNPHPSLTMKTPILDKSPMTPELIKLILKDALGENVLIRRYKDGKTLIWFNAQTPPEKLSKVFSDLDKFGSLYIEPSPGKVYSTKYVEGYWIITNAKNKVADSLAKPTKNEVADFDSRADAKTDDFGSSAEHELENEVADFGSLVESDCIDFNCPCPHCPNRR